MANGYMKTSFGIFQLQIVAAAPLVSLTALPWFSQNTF